MAKLDKNSDFELLYKQQIVGLVCTYNTLSITSCVVLCGNSEYRWPRLSLDMSKVSSAGKIVIGHSSKLYIYN